MTRSCSVAASLLLGALALTPAALAVPPPPGSSSCLAKISYNNAQSRERDEYAQSTVEGYQAPGRDFYRYNAQTKTENCV